MSVASMPEPRSRRGIGGPRTPAGKARSSRNALRHGLSAVSDALAAIRDRGEPVVLAKAAALLVEDPPSPDGAGDDPPQGCAGLDLRDRALDVAVAELDLHRFRVVRASILDQLEADRAPLHEIAEHLGGDGVRVAAIAGMPLEPALSSSISPHAADLAAGVNRIAALERYHAQALARLHRARAAFEAAWAHRPRRPCP